MMPFPLLYLFRILFLLVGASIFAWILHHALLIAFFNNPILDGFILVLLFAGCFRNIILIFTLIPAVKWVKSLVDGQSSTRPRHSWLNPLYTVIERASSNTFTSPEPFQNALESISQRLDERRETNRYLTGLLIFLGLLGTFYGLILTVSSISDVINNLSIQAENVSAVFEHLKSGLAKPLYGMGTAFSGSMFGLAGALLVGFCDLTLGQAQNRFYTFLEDKLNYLQYALSLEEGKPEYESPHYIQALLTQSAESMNNLYTLLQHIEQDRLQNTKHLYDIQQGIATLNTITENLIQLTKQQIFIQQDLSKTFQENGALLNAPASASVATALSTINTQLSIVINQITNRQEELSKDIRAEIRLLTKTLALSLESLTPHSKN